MLGDVYYKRGNHKRAYTWFHKAALRNHTEAQARVGYMHQRGQGVLQDYKQAMDWNMKAASNGNNMLNITLLNYIIGEKVYQPIAN
jgi:TPR repeat protein